jgi:hypothetical protein
LFFSNFDKKYLRDCEEAITALDLPAFSLVDVGLKSFKNSISTLFRNNFFASVSSTQTGSSPAMIAPPIPSTAPTV